MSVMVSLQLPIQPDKFDEAVGVMKEILPDTRAFEGCEQVDTYLDRDGSSILLIERWEKPEHQQAYMNWRIESGFMEQAGAFAAGPPAVTTWEIASDV